MYIQAEKLDAVRFNSKSFQLQAASDLDIADWEGGNLLEQLLAGGYRIQKTLPGVDYLWVFALHPMAVDAAQTYQKIMQMKKNRNSFSGAIYAN